MGTMLKNTTGGALLAAFLLILLSTGCVGPSRFGPVEELLAQDVGRLTYEEAVDRWGQPNSVDRGPRLFTAYWIRKRAVNMLTERLYLTFDNQAQVLRSYRYQQQPFE